MKGFVCITFTSTRNIGTILNRSTVDKNDVTQRQVRILRIINFCNDNNFKFSLILQYFEGKQDADSLTYGTTKQISYPI